LGQFLPKSDVCVMSVQLPDNGLKLDSRHFAFGPKAAVSMCSKNPLSEAILFDHLIGAGD
jgi:hypothetical protein